MKKSRTEKRRCRGCKDKKAVFLCHGRPRWDRHHDLCRRCYRSERDRQQARHEAA